MDTQADLSNSIGHLAGFRRPVPRRPQRQPGSSRSSTSCSTLTRTPPASSTSRRRTRRGKRISTTCARCNAELGSYSLARGARHDPRAPPRPVQRSTADRSSPPRRRMGPVGHGLHHRPVAGGGGWSRLPLLPGSTSAPGRRPRSDPGYPQRSHHDRRQLAKAARAWPGRTAFGVVVRFRSAGSGCRCRFRRPCTS